MTTHPYASKSRLNSAVYKVILVGDMGVGKTHILYRILGKEISGPIHSTIGAEFATKGFQTAAGDKVRAQLWDTAGQDRYQAIVKAHYRNAVGALAVFDVMRQESFTSLEKWIKEIQDAAEPDIQIMIVGNKIDLISSLRDREVPRREAETFASRHSCLYEEVSAITSTNIEDSFERLLAAIVKSQNERAIKEAKKSVIVLNPSEQDQNSRCCS
eukprot:TRINITY_DN4858_c0_g2_i6.p1 TRINITY_DN4858_c0_g2~~TRINITY_DN4858_c0_g2_i6.p1  ORF type:complete len:214 (-),score=29.25 TRINITY_DN4858_c0_g2_i6:59-700(-)